MTYRWIEDIEEFRKVAEEWDDALISSENYNPFLLSDFITAWWRHFHDSRKLKIFMLCKNNQILDGMPLYLKRYGPACCKVGILNYIGGSAANITHSLLNKNCFNLTEKLISSLQQEEGWDFLVLNRVLANNSLLEEIANFQITYSGKFIFKIYDGGANGIIDLTAGYENIIAGLPERLRRYLKNCKRQASSIGKLTLQRISGISGVAELFDEYMHLSVESFRARNAASAFEDTTYCNFFKEILAAFEKKKRLDAHRLTAGRCTLGISFGYRFGTGFKWILTSFNPKFHRLRPGHLLLDALVRDAINRGDRFFDMYYGGELLYKRQWCNKMTPIKRLEICRDSYFNRGLSWATGALKSRRKFVHLVKKAQKIINPLTPRSKDRGLLED